MIRKGIGRSVREHVAAIVAALLDLSIGAALRAVKRLRKAAEPHVALEVERSCSRCGRSDEIAAGHYLIYREKLWCIDCYDRARGGVVVRHDPLASSTTDELGLVN